MRTIAVVGAGPAGMIAAAEAAAKGADVTLFERNEKTGKKLYITGKGRCNVTNSAQIEDFMASIPRNPRFLYSALFGFTNADTVRMIEDEGVRTKVERGGRVFPESDKSSDILRAFTARLKKTGVKVELSSRVESIRRTGNGFILRVNGRDRAFERVILATGGISYPSTGSTGDGFAFASALGHGITELKPSLISFVTKEEWPKKLMGLSLRNVTLRAYDKKGRKRFEELGEMLFTHYGVSGPLVHSASSVLADDPAGAVLAVDLKPALNEEELDRRILRDFADNNRKQFINALDALLPQKLIPVAVELSGIPAHKDVSEITREMRRGFAALLKDMRMSVDRAMPIDEAIVTRGGVSVREIDPSTMESKLIPGLYFAGEMIDVDAFTGGFNIQIACSTGALAGRSAADD